LFHSMVPDVNGRERLRIITDKDGKKSISSAEIASCWSDYRIETVNYLKPGESNDQDANAAQQRFEAESEKTYHEFVTALDNYLAENLSDIEAYFDSLNRFEDDKEADQEAPFQKETRWLRMRELRGEAAVWLNDLETREKTYKNALYELMNQYQRQKIDSQWPDFKIWNWDRMSQINFTVTYALTAIGACLILGFFTRFAALGGAAFMCFIIMTQPAWSTIYPPDSDIVGHALLINKDFIELVALLLMFTLPVGRWGGIDFFLHRWFCKPSSKEPSLQITVGKK
jgi:uncharacterized membrane protein YphA (DoxX/SURF4 family)